MRSVVRWSVPAAVAVVIAGGVAANSAQAGNTPDLPSRTAAQVLASVAGSSVTALSGTVVTRADLGLPSLSGLTSSSGMSSGDATSPTGLITRFLTGQNTMRVWVDGPSRMRTQLLDPFSELDVVRNGTDLWTYSSRGNTVQHGTVTSADASAATSPAMAQDLTPAQAADRAIAAAGPDTTVSLGEPTVVAGRSAYTLTLTPTTDATLVARIVVAVDAARGVPLQVQVFARGHGQPALETGFTDVDFAVPSADRFTFTPPKGATVTPLRSSSSASSHSAALPAAQRPTVIGTGWSEIVEIPAATVRAAMMSSAGSPSGSPESGSMSSGSMSSGSTMSRSMASGSTMSGMMSLLTPVDGGEGMTSALASVLITSDGRVLIGAVPLQALADAAK